MNRLPILAAALVAATAFLAPAALADDGKGKGPGKGGWKAMATFEAMDANKDAALSLAELKAGLADKPRMLARADKMFGRVDANDDGKVVKAEFDAWKARRAQMRGKHGGKHGGRHHGGEHR